MSTWRREIVETERGNFEVFVTGQGTPLCVTHLYSEFRDIGNRFADPFIDLYQVILVNLKEAGYSDKVVLEEELSMRESVKDLEAIRTTLGFERWSFAGTSTGGMLGLVYAIDFPQSLTSLTVADTCASKAYMNAPGSIYCPENPHNSRLRELMRIVKAPDSTPEERLTAGREWTEMSLYRLEKYDEYFAVPSSGKTVLKRLDYYAYRELPHFDVRCQLIKVTVPTLVICGRHDSQCPVEFSEEIHQLIPTSTLAILDESDHMPYIEEPEKFHDIIKRFAVNIGLY